MRKRDIETWQLAREAGAVVTALVRDMDAGIACRVFDSVGPASRPTQLVHGGPAQSVWCGGLPDSRHYAVWRHADLPAAARVGDEIDGYPGDGGDLARRGPRRRFGDLR